MNDVVAVGRVVGERGEISCGRTVWGVALGAVAGDDDVEVANVFGVDIFGVVIFGVVIFGVVIFGVVIFGADGLLDDGFGVVDEEMDGADVEETILRQYP